MVHHINLSEQMPVRNLSSIASHLLHAVTCIFATKETSKTMVRAVVLMLACLFVSCSSTLTPGDSASHAMLRYENPAINTPIRDRYVATWDKMDGDKIIRHGRPFKIRKETNQEFILVTPGRYSISLLFGNNPVYGITKDTSLARAMEIGRFSTQKRVAHEADATLSVNLEAGHFYKPRFSVSGPNVTMWIEDQATGEAVTERKSAAINIRLAEPPASKPIPIVIMLP